MIIGVDGNEANVDKRVGVSVYTYNLLKYFRKKADGNNQFRIYFRTLPKNLPDENKYFRYVIVKGSFLWSQIFLPLNLYMQKNIDVFFSPAHYLPRFCPVPAVVTIHDLSYLFFPDDFLPKDLYQLRNWTGYSLNKAKKVIAVSKTTKKDLIKKYSIPDGKIEVVHNGYEKPGFKDSVVNKNLALDAPFVLHVGTLQPRKNIGVLISAFDKFRKTFPEFKLVITGKKGWLYEKIFKQVSDLGLEKQVVFTGFVNDSDLNNLYKNAFCLVLPSLYEGFGIPLLEAMNAGCPVIAAENSSLPEIGGDACLYFDPNDETELVQKLIKLKEDKTLSESLRNKGYKRINNFSWEKCASQTLEIIRSVH